MRYNRGAFLTLAVLGGYFVWRNRFAIQQQLESLGIKTPLLKGNLHETVSSVGSKISGKFEHGTDKVQDEIERKVGNY